MSKQPDIKWDGKSGKEYGYWIYPIGSTFDATPANYIFAKETSRGRWRPIYAGETGDIADRMSNHEKEKCAKSNGATHIHVHTSSNVGSVRRAEEKDIILK